MLILIFFRFFFTFSTCTNSNAICTWHFKNPGKQNPKTFKIHLYSCPTLLYLLQKRSFFFSCFSYTYEISTSKSIKCIFSYLSYLIKYSIQIKASGLVHNLIYTITSRMLNSRQTGCDVITQVCIPKKSFSS